MNYTLRSVNPGRVFVHVQRIFINRFVHNKEAAARRDHSVFGLLRVGRNRIANRGETDGLRVATVADRGFTPKEVILALKLIEFSRVLYFFLEESVSVRKPR